MAGFEEGVRGQGPRNTGGFWKLGKAAENKTRQTFPLEPPENKCPCRHLNFSPARPVLNL